MHNFWKYFAFFAAVLLLVSCTKQQAVNMPDMSSIVMSTSTEKVVSDYILQPGDVINIKFYFNSKLNETIPIRPDGKISLQLIDEVVAAGITPAELDRKLTEKYSDELEYPEIAVIVRSFEGRRVYVGGEVNSPGMIPASAGLTSFQAIMHAGGFKDTSELESVVILRNNGSGKPLFLTVNLEEDLKNHASHNDILLKSFDIVFVPKTTIAKLNQFVEQYITKLIPISLNAGFSWVHNINPEVRIKD